MPHMDARKAPPRPDLNLLNDLTVEDARTILRNEGGLTPAQLAYELVSVAAVSAMTARAIWSGGATAWHLALPMLAQYLALLVTMPLFYFVLRHPGLRKDALGGIRLLVVLVLVAIVAELVRSRQNSLSLDEQTLADLRAAKRWIVDAKMTWPIVLSIVAVLQGLRHRVRNLVEHGGAFYGVSLGCAMRVVVLILGCFLLPFAMSSGVRMTWTIWGMILAAELLALGMIWDVQHRLKKVDAAGGNERILR
jgi:hypothetical protein